VNWTAIFGGSNQKCNTKQPSIRQLSYAEILLAFRLHQPLNPSPTSLQAARVERKTDFAFNADHMKRARTMMLAIVADVIRCGIRTGRHWRRVSLIAEKGEEAAHVRD
jgi:hypothetical protein